MIRTSRLSLGVLTCFSVAFSFLYLAYAGETIEGTPGFAPDKGTHDFGSQSQQTRLKTEFEFTNTYGQHVRIDQVIRGCSCAEATASTTSVPPNGKCKLLVAWNTGSRRGPAREVIDLIYSLGPDATQSIRVEIISNVAPEFQVSETEVVFSRGTPGEMAIQSVPRNESDGLIRNAASTHRNVAAKVSADGRSVLATYTPTTEPGDDDGFALHVSTHNERSPFLSIPIRIRD